MTIEGPDRFPRAFAAAFGAQDADAIAALLTPEAGVLTLSGRWAEGPDAAREAWALDFAGPLARARLVTGRVSATPGTADIVVLHQRYVVSGVTDGDGEELPRIAAIMAATLALTPDGWRALSLCLAPLA